MIRWFIVSVLCSFLISTAYADEYRPAYLELQQSSADVYHVLWKVPARGADKRLSLYVVFAGDVETIKPVRAAFIGRAFIERSTIRRSDGLTGSEIKIKGLERVSTDVLVRIQRLDGSSETTRLNAATTSFIVAGIPQFWEVVKTYLLFGVEHILEGYDHLLFIACLIFIAGTWKRILVTITGFTLAHSITLTLAALGLVRLPVPPIEAVISLSIVDANFPSPREGFPSTASKKTLMDFKSVPLPLPVFVCSVENVRPDVTPSADDTSGTEPPEFLQITVGEPSRGSDDNPHRVLVQPADALRLG